jgi:V/A-type H+-transporting ATPase subunit K
MELFLLPLIVVILLAMPLIPVVRGKLKGKKAKRAFIFNLCSFFGLMLIAVILPLGGFVSAEAGGAVSKITDSSTGMGYLAAALVTGMSAIGAGIAVAAAAPAAIGAVSEEPKSFVKALIFVALGEGVALYGLLISILIINKL